MWKVKWWANREKIMNRNVKTALIVVIAAVAIFLAYRILFIRTVNYEIGSIKIPSKYNVLTGKVTPILDYKGREPARVVEKNPTKKLGLTGDEVAIARFRWAMFEQWAKQHPEYKGWESDPEIFAKAQEEFESSGWKVRVVK